jgi:hypothetical protein
VKKGDSELNRISFFRLFSLGSLSKVANKPELKAAVNQAQGLSSLSCLVIAFASVP